MQFYSFKYSYLIQIILKLIYLTHRWVAYTYYHSNLKVYLGVMEPKRYSTVPRTPELKSHHLMEFSVILRTSFLVVVVIGGITLYWGCSQYILTHIDWANLDGECNYYIFFLFQFQFLPLMAYQPLWII